MGGKKGGAKVEVTDYYLSEHFGICTGPLDALTKVIVKEKDAWSGQQTDLGSFTIDLPELFGGNKKEGGLAGLITYLPGESDQLLPDFLAQKLGRADGADCPGYRGLASLFFTGHGNVPTSGVVGTVLAAKLGLRRAMTGFYWTSNNPYLPGVWATVRRILKRADGTEQWYPEKAAIGYGVVAGVEVAVTWFQATIDHVAVGDDDGARMGVGFLDASGALIGSVTWAAMLIPSPPETWVERAVSATAPSGAAVVRLYMEMERNTGTSNDGYIDQISASINGVTVALTNPGAESGTAGWTNQTGSLGVIPPHPISPGDEPAPYAGSSYFFGGQVASTVAYQDIASGYDMNPAHIIHECLTDTTWGMGSPLAALDETSFIDAADTLYAERFGLSMMWTRQATIQSFVQEVLDHIQGVLFVDPSTGLLTLKLIRGDYDLETLPILTPDNSDLTSFNRKLWGDIVNEIVVTWTNPENEQEETITAQDLASIATQGGVVSDGRNYYGVRRADLAQDLAFRDLRSAGQPLAACEAEVNRSQWQLRPASVIKLTWPEYGLDELVMRVTSIDYGRPGDPTIKLSLMEDVYGLDIGAYDAPPSTEWVDPSAAPEPIETVEVFTLPLFFAANSTVAAFVETPEYPEVLAGVLATTENTDTSEYELWDEITLSNGSAEWRSLGSRNIIGRGELGELLSQEVSSTAVTFDSIVGQTSPAVAGFVLIGDEGEDGNEIAMVEAIDDDTGEHTLTRGVLDTVPRAWPAGTPVWFVDGSTLLEDPRVRSAGEVVDYKLRTRTSLGLLALEDADLESYTLTERPWLPNRPANVDVEGVPFNTVGTPVDMRTRPDPWVTINWANRNRLLEDSQVLAWTDGTVTPETGQTTMIEVLAEDGATVLDTHTGLSGTSFDVPDSSFGSAAIVLLRAWAERSDADGDFVSLQAHGIWVQVADGELITEEGDAVLAEDGNTLDLEG